MSSGAVAGIVVGIVAVVLIAVALLGEQLSGCRMPALLLFSMDTTAQG
jgi:hypothetical protein